MVQLVESDNEIRVLLTSIFMTLFKHSHLSNNFLIMSNISIPPHTLNIQTFLKKYTAGAPISISQRLNLK